MYDQVFPYLRALTESDPWNERAYSWLMITLAGAGRQVEALRIYDGMRQRLDEFGMMPGAELAEAHMRVLRQEIPVLLQ
jgi:DNA-binding SARP family transcriptional activator